MFRRFQGVRAVLLLGLLGLLGLTGNMIGAAPARRQSRAIVTIDRDIRVFTMMAALNAAGFDFESGGESKFHLVRTELRTIARELDPAVTARLKKFYQSHKDNQPDEAQLSKYIALALSLGGPPDFSLAIREEKMPPDARYVLRFADLLKEFYLGAHIPEHWVLARPFYDHEAETLGPPVRDAIRRADGYLRATVGTGPLHTMGIIVELSAPKNTVNVQSAQDDYHVILGSSTTPRIAEIRHAYLHMSIDAALFAAMNSIDRALPLLALAAHEDGVQPEYTVDLYSMTRESLVRAIELRLDRPPAESARQTTDEYYRSGLLLVPFFLGALPAYEQEEKGLTAYIATLLTGLNVKDEQKRFQNTFHAITIPVRQPKVSEPVMVEYTRRKLDPKQDLLVDASEALLAGEIVKARAFFEKVLATYDREDGAALYGLALIAGRQEDDKAARKYFERVVKSASSEPAIKVWSYIYLGRLDDLQCERQRAVENYREAIKVADNTRNAQTVAREGIAQAFGAACPQP